MTTKSLGQAGRLPSGRCAGRVRTQQRTHVTSADECNIPCRVGPCGNQAAWSSAKNTSQHPSQCAVHGSATRLGCRGWRCPTWQCPRKCAVHGSATLLACRGWRCTRV
eukprot:350576-Chlamydomonas_euryale.AAC.5